MPLSSLTHFGTSTWAYEDWQGIEYHKPYPKKRLKQDCLAEYANYEYKGERLFTTVDFDFTFYGPPSPALPRHYAAQLPAGFRACAKVWQESQCRSSHLVYAIARWLERTRTSLISPEI